MPIEGFPDPAVHKLCIACRKWHEPSDGVQIAPQGPGIASDPLTALTFGLSHLFVPRTETQFICYRCRWRRIVVSVTIWVSLLAILAALLLLEFAGVI